MRPTKNFTCHECNQYFALATYGIQSATGKFVCDNCCNQLDELSLTNSNRQTIYPNFEKRIVTNWLGYKLGTIVSIGNKPHNFCQYDMKYHCHIKDIHGNFWCGWMADCIASNIKKSS